MAALKLLIAEDDLALAALLEEYLVEYGYEVDVHHRGDTALESLKTRHYDLILTDVVMPGADGLTLLARAGGDPEKTLVILMTGYSGIDDAIHAVDQGAYDFVSKPFQLPEIKVRLDNAARYQTLLRRWNEVADEQSMHSGAEDAYRSQEMITLPENAAVKAYVSGK